MCGINGLIGFDDSKRLIACMNEAIKHRGPDAGGEWFKDNLALGHRRLSIIDLSAKANQPFVKDDLVIVYNGEVYNFLELKEDLLKRGVRFRTHSDTEVILELFRIYKEESFNKLIGMFSFCIYDLRSKEMFLVRDYFGIKPLYYTVADNNKFAFSSELKALIKLPEIKREINPKALVSCINYLWISGDGSIFKGINKLPPAHYLRLRTDQGGSSLEIKKYWDLKIRDSGLSEERFAKELGGLLEKSVKRHLIADVPVGAFLSGGLDSSLICAMAKRFNPDLSTYTISVGAKDKKIEKMPDDNLYARRLAQEMGLNHTDIPVQPRIIENLEETVAMLDEPIGDPAAINTYLICKMARDKGIKVLLSGMGADEIFGGYRRQYAALLADRFRGIPSFVRNILNGVLAVSPVRIGNYGIRTVRWAKRLAAFAGMPLEAAYMRSYSYYGKDELRELFNHNLNNTIDVMYEEHKEIFYRIKEFDNINKMCYTDINMFMPGLNLTYTDRASMAASVETRVPFIDKEVVELAMSAPGRYKINKNVSKYILKKAAIDYLPLDIIQRPKASFGLPLRAWISGELRGLVDELLSEKNIKQRGLLNPDLVKKIVKKNRAGLEDNAYRIYQFLTLELWCRRYLD